MRVGESSACFVADCRTRDADDNAGAGGEGVAWICVHIAESGAESLDRHHRVALFKSARPPARCQCHARAEQAGDGAAGGDRGEFDPDGDDAGMGAESEVISPVSGSRFIEPFMWRSDPVKVSPR